MIELKNISLKYPKFSFQELNLQFETSEIVAITGNNASGKTTLLNLIGGICKPNKGEILFDKIPLKKSKKIVGFVFQNPDNQIIFNKVYDDIAFTLKNYGVDKKEYDKRIDEALLEVDMLKYKDSETFNLSAGQKQRIAIANMLAIHPDIILFDEASVYLDTATKQVLYRVFLKLKSQGVTVIFATNMIDEIVFADRVLLLDKGRVISFNKTQQFLENPKIFEEHGLFVPLKIMLISNFGLFGEQFDEDVLKALKKQR